MYWTQRIIKQSDILFDKREAEVNKTLAKYYQSALDDIQILLERIYDKVSNQQSTSISDLYQYDRYYIMREQILNTLHILGSKTNKALRSKLVLFYNDIQNVMDKEDRLQGSFVEAGRANQVINSIWCADGKHWSQRVWNNMGQLNQDLEKTLVDCLVIGTPKDKFVEAIAERFSVSFSQADRLVRTELSYVQNQSSADRYTAAGFDTYEWLTASDERTCDKCGKMNGKKFLFAAAAVGQNFPPLHPNDRCTIIPVIRS